MALNIPSIELSNTGLILNNGYARITSFSWDINNYTELSVVISTWKDKEAFLQQKNRLFTSQHIITITDSSLYTQAYNDIALLIYTFLRDNTSIFANSTIID